MRFIARVTESKALVIDFVGASLVTTYFRLSDLLFEKCFTVLEGEQSRFLLGLATRSAKLVLTHKFFHEVSHSVGFITLSGTRRQNTKGKGSVGQPRQDHCGGSKPES